MYNIKLWLNLYDIEYGVEMTPSWYDLDARSYQIYSVQGGRVSVDSEINIVSHEDFKKILMERIVEKASNADERSIGQGKNGRFVKGNRCAEKLHISDEELYLLYKVCGSKVTVAEKLNICRQTVWRRIKRFEPEMDWFIERYWGTNSTTPKETRRDDDDDFILPF